MKRNKAISILKLRDNDFPMTAKELGRVLVRLKRSIPVKFRHNLIIEVYATDNLDVHIDFYYLRDETDKEEHERMQGRGIDDAASRREWAEYNRLKRKFG